MQENVWKNRWKIDFFTSINRKYRMRSAMLISKVMFIWPRLRTLTCLRITVYRSLLDSPIKQNMHSANHSNTMLTLYPAWIPYIVPHYEVTLQLTAPPAYSDQVGGWADQIEPCTACRLENKQHLTLHTISQPHHTGHSFIPISHIFHVT